METSTITREKLLSLMDEWGQAGSAELVTAVLEEIGFGDKQTFTKADFGIVMQGVTRYAQREMDGPAMVDTDVKAREEMQSLLADLDQHALGGLGRA